MGINLNLIPDTNSMNPPGPPKRAVAEPPTSTVIKGPREGFIEDADDNISLIKKRIKKDFKTIELQTGKYTQTKIIIAYVSSIADQKVIDKVKQRIEAIEIDGIIDSHYIAQFLQDEKVKLFRQVGSDEKPDIIASKLLEGRIAIIVDGSPIVLTVPYILFEDVQQSNDYYMLSSNVSLRRFIRIAGAFIAILGPGIYIAVQLYHYNIIPINLLITITNTTGNSPFSPMLETIFVLILFEILYEATLHMPKSMAGVTGIVGALVLGDTAVKAGLISPPAVLVSALSGITMYIIPDLAPQISLLRFAFALIGGVLGLFGIIITGLLLIIYLAGMDSYGSPYLAPYAPYIKEDTKDAVFKSGVRQMIKRPKSIPNINPTRANIKTKPQNNKQARSK